MQYFALVGLFFIITAVLPVFFWLLYFSYQDRKEPEPKKTVLRLFFWGIITAFLIMLLKRGASFILLDAKTSLTFEYLTSDKAMNQLTIIRAQLLFFVAGVLEEGVKFFILKTIIFKKRVFNQIIDGVVYGTTLALGFAFAENSLYFINFFNQLDQAELFFNSTMRGVATVLLHVVATGIIGFYLGKSKFKKKGKTLILLKGLTLGSILHACFNVFLQLKTPLNYLAFLILLIGFIFLSIKISKKDSKIIWWRQKT
ncbi:MAG: PrsW family intramembrane metalloprotease [Candidatus Moranbacteria bacterium]|nr:PrsW family intramembrane metalloprotease [Candidatus Moranbacteria bacterium]